MALFTSTETDWGGLDLGTTVRPRRGQVDRIRAALGSTTDELPRVDAASHHKYYQYLCEHLSLPFAAHYPQATTPEEAEEFRCIVVELLDPEKHVGDELDGIFCKTRKGRFEVNLPLIELHVPQNSRNFQLIEDYWYWFWNWR